MEGDEAETASVFPLRSLRLCVMPSEVDHEKRNVLRRRWSEREFVESSIRLLSKGHHAEARRTQSLEFCPNRFVHPVPEKFAEGLDHANLYDTIVHSSSRREVRRARGDGMAKGTRHGASDGPA